MHTSRCLLIVIFKDAFFLTFQLGDYIVILIIEQSILVKSARRRDQEDSFHSKTMEVRLVGKMSPKYTICRSLIN